MKDSCKVVDDIMEMFKQKPNKPFEEMDIEDCIASMKECIARKSDK